MIELQELLNKAQSKKANRKMEAEIVVPSLGGALLFKRPKDAEILKYENICFNATEYEYFKEVINDKEEDRAIIKKMDIESIYEISNIFIVDNCEYLRNPELLEVLGVSDPYDVTKVLFSHKEVNDIAEKVYKEFANTDIKEDIKN